jgi:hypothetical protein
MKRIVHGFLFFGLVLACFGLVTSCNITGSSSGTGNLMMLMTDGPTDDWTEVTVHFLSASLHRFGAPTWETFWTANTADPASGKVNLVDLSGISDILNAGPINAGTYDRLKLVMNTSTDANSMTIIPADTNKQVAPEDITVVDPSGNGEIKVDLSTPLVVTSDSNNIVSIDFDLRHPLSIVNLDGKVVISLKVRCRALPRNLSQIQFGRTLGDITGATTNQDGTATLQITNLQGAVVTFTANGNTVYTDVTSGTAQTGNFDDFSKAKAALVASNMQNDGTLYARHIWYADDITKLPQFTPEGLVRRVGDSWLSISKKQAEATATGEHHHRCDWNSETVFVNADTHWFFQGADMGVTGLDGLAYVSRGYRVEVEYTPENVTPKIAVKINIQFASAEGIVVEPTVDNFKLGWFWHVQTMLYSAVSDHEFGWWNYGMDSGRSADRQALIDMVAAAKTAHFWVFAWAGLTWDATAKQWEVQDLILAPMKLHDFTKIKSAYNADTTQPETMVVSTYNCWDWSTPEDMTIKLDPTGDLQTIVGSFIWNGATHVVTFTLPVNPDRWGTLLTPTIDKVKIWVHPVEETDGTFTWHAYSVIAYQFIQP